MEQKVLVVEDLCRFCLSSKQDRLIRINERQAMQFFDLTQRELPFNDFYYPPNACIQCCNDLENMSSFKNLLLQRQDELEIILQSVSVTEDYTNEEEEDVIEEYLEESEDISEAQDLRKLTKIISDKPSVKNLSTTPNKTDILKLIEDIEKNNQLIYENSKPTIMWKKRKPRSADKSRPSETETSCPFVNEIPQPQSFIDSSDDRSANECKNKNNSRLKNDRQDKQNDLLECCYQIFESTQEYKNHKKIVHAVEAITCKSCSKVLKNQKTYRIHLKSHIAASERKYKCNVCETKAFNMKIHLENHLRTHTNQNPFKCPLPDCSTAFKQKHQIKLHLRNKHNINSTSLISNKKEMIDDNMIE